MKLFQINIKYVYFRYYWEKFVKQDWILFALISSIHVLDMVFAINVYYVNFNLYIWIWQLESLHKLNIFTLLSLLLTLNIYIANLIVYISRAILNIVTC